MKIKRFIDTDMRQVLRKVRQEQGADAVILSNRRVEGGIEVIAAVDYDEALMRQALGPMTTSQPDGGAESESAARPVAPAASLEERPVRRRPAAARPVAATKTAAIAPAAQGVSQDTSKAERNSADIAALAGMRSELSSLRGLLETQLSGLVWKNSTRRTPLRAQVLRNLARIGLPPDVANTIVNSLEPIEGIRQLWREPLVKLAQTIPVTSDELLTQGGTVALIGPTGVGKTTTIAKIAARYAMQNGAQGIALVCADAFRIGAREHLEAFGNIIGVKVHAASDAGELTGILDRLQHKRLVLIDTEGLSQRDMALSTRLAAYREHGTRIRFYLTLSAASQEAGLDETVRQFSRVPLAGAVITKIDEAAQLGCVIGTLIRHELGAAWLSDGQRIPDDLHPADKKKLWLVNRAVECLEMSEPRIDERTMAENYGFVSVAHA
ncbi:MAG: flagellar biosynthesis protein FlhF [Woeseiaceae bacterium]